ncbi:MAG: phosphate ABC transporter substrate-binding protein PstS family protein [Solirubrobacterales bacterium]|nr:phosphate ABC transporter substrate-binding protein PstS family protein [Solirubrobacterales bacterium]
MRSKNFCAVLAAGALAFGAAACGDDEEEPASSGAATATETAPAEEGTDVSGLSGSIRIDGSSTVEPLANAAAELISEEGAQLQVTVGGAGTGDGFEKFCRGELDISDASRAIEADEFENCAAKDIVPVEVQVGIDGLSVVTNKSLEFPDNCISTDQLKELLAPGSKVKNYSELGEGFPDAPVSFFTPGTESGTYDYFTEAALETDAEQRTQNVQTSADDNQIVTGISGTEGALGYVGYAFAEENKDNLNILAVDGGDGCVEPTNETIASNEYAPLSRPLFMYPSVETVKKPEIAGFLNFIVGENNQTITDASGYIQLTDELKAKSVAAIEGATPVEAPAE